MANQGNVSAVFARSLFQQVLNPILDFYDQFKFMDSLQQPNDYWEYLNDMVERTNTLMQWVDRDSDNPTIQMRVRSLDQILNQPVIETRSALPYALTTRQLWALFPELMVAFNQMQQVLSERQALIDPLNDYTQKLLAQHQGESNVTYNFNEPIVRDYYAEMNFAVGFFHGAWNQIDYFTAILATQILDRFNDWQALEPGERMKHDYNEMLENGNFMTYRDFIEDQKRNQHG